MLRDDRKLAASQGQLSGINVGETQGPQDIDSGRTDWLRYGKVITQHRVRQAHAANKAIKQQFKIGSTIYYINQKALLKYYWMK